MAKKKSPRKPMTPAAEMLLDLDVLVPVHRNFVRFTHQITECGCVYATTAPQEADDAAAHAAGRHKYPVSSLLDVPYGEALEALRLDLELRDKAPAQQYARCRRQIRILCASMPEMVLDTLPIRKMIRIAAEFMLVAKKDDEEPNPANPPREAGA